MAEFLFASEAASGAPRSGGGARQAPVNGQITATNQEWALPPVFLHTPPAHYDRMWIMIERSISASTHGRYLVAKANPGSPLLVGFHGYAESAEHEYKRLNSIAGVEYWNRVAVQGLHRFYRGASRDVVASWMTHQDREHAIADNCAYVAKVVDDVVAEQSPSPILVFHGFSQGVGMALRAAASSRFRVRGVMITGGDVPPELDANCLMKIRSVLLGRGTEDSWYTEEKFGSDERRLRAAGIDVQTIRFQAGHEWAPEFRRAAGDFLEMCRSQQATC